MIGRLLAVWREWRRKRALRKRIARLSREDRAAILVRSPYEPYWEQGMEGATHVIARGEPDFGEAMAKGGGYFPSVIAAEDWIIGQALEVDDMRSAFGDISS